MWNVLRPIFLLAPMLLLCATVQAQLRAVPFVSGLTQPLEFVQDPSDASVQYVAEQGGRIRVIKDGALQPTSFIDLSGLVTLAGERGLLGLAFPPNYLTSGRFYVYYTRKGDGSGNEVGDIVVARYERSAGNPLVADPLTRKDLLWGSVRGLPLPLLKFSGGSVTFYATFSTDTAIPSC
jgi:glucose/arabinose dehydrogenase